MEEDLREVCALNLVFAAGEYQAQVPVLTGLGRLASTRNNGGFHIE